MLIILKIVNNMHFLINKPTIIFFYVPVHKFAKNLIKIHPLDNFYNTPSRIKFSH